MSLQDKAQYLAYDESPHRELGRCQSVVSLTAVAMCLATDVFEEVLVLEVAEVLNARSLKDLITGVE